MALRRLTSRLNHGPLTAARGLSTLRIVAQLKMLEREGGMCEGRYSFMIRIVCNKYVYIYICIPYNHLFVSYTIG